MNVFIFGYGLEGIKLYRELKSSNAYDVVGFADNSVYKYGNYVGSYKIMSVDELVLLKKGVDFSTIIASEEWYEIGEIWKK